MPRIGLKNNRIKAIIYHTSCNPNLDDPKVYLLEDGKHICLMPRATRTNYRKKEKIKKLRIKSKYLFQQKVYSDKSSYFSSQGKSTDLSSQQSHESKSTNVISELNHTDETDAKNTIMKISSYNENDKLSAFFQIDDDQFNSDSFFNNSDFDE